MGIARVIATEHLDPDQSVVRSGIALADVVLSTLEKERQAEVSFEGLKGASSSYFNVFLRRIQEGCGLAELGVHIKLVFGSSIQEMVFNRSLEAISKGPREEIQLIDSTQTDTLEESHDKDCSLVTILLTKIIKLIAKR